MDDCLSECGTGDETSRLFAELKMLLAEGGFHVYADRIHRDTRLSESVLEAWNGWHKGLLTT